MEFADDIAYAVHDVEDCYRAGMVPLERFTRRDSRERAVFVEGMSGYWEKCGIAGTDAAAAVETILSEPLTSPELDRPYDGGRLQRAALRRFTSSLIGRLIRSVEFTNDDPSEPKLSLPEALRHELIAMKGLMSFYVFSHPSLRAQQRGHKRVISELYAALAESLKDDARGGLLPLSYRELLRDERRRAADYGGEDAVVARVVADVVASMTEDEALRMHRRLTGLDGGTVRDPILH